MFAFVKMFLKQVFKSKRIYAIEGAIAKWKLIAYDGGTDRGTTDCALCQLYHVPKHSIEYCIGCPVYQHTGETWCRSTPYEQWSRIVKGGYNASSLNDLSGEKLNIAKEIAIDELNFLKMILKKEMKK